MNFDKFIIRLHFLIIYFMFFKKIEDNSYFIKVQIFCLILPIPFYTLSIKTCHMSINLIKMLDLCYFLISNFLLFKFR